MRSGRIVFCDSEEVGFQQQAWMKKVVWFVCVGGLASTSGNDGGDFVVVVISLELWVMV